MSHDPNNETTRRVVRADDRLKLVKAADDVAHALEKLHLACQKADPKDLLVLAENFPFDNLNANVKHDVADQARAAMLWAIGLHDNKKFEQLGTRRWPDGQRER